MKSQTAKWYCPKQIVFTQLILLMEISCRFKIRLAWVWTIVTEIQTMSNISFCRDIPYQFKACIVSILESFIQDVRTYSDYVDYWIYDIEPLCLWPYSNFFISIVCISSFEIERVEFSMTNIDLLTFCRPGSPACNFPQIEPTNSSH